MTFAPRIYLTAFLFIPTLASVAAPGRVETSEVGNTYVSGGNVLVNNPVPADLLAAAGKIRVEQQVGADAALAGGSVEVRAPVGQDVRAAAGTLDLADTIGGELVAAGGTIRLEKTAAVAGSAWLAGGDVIVDGRIAKGARIAARTVSLSGQIDGDTRLYAQEIHFLPGAKINGNLSYASPTPLSQEQAAHVLGTITREPLPDGRDAKHRGMRSLFWFLPVFLLSMVLCGALLYWLFPNATGDVQRTIRQYPLRSGLIGLALLFTVPPLAILLMVTVIGIPVGLTLLMLYPPMLLLGFLTAAFFIGRRAADAMKQAQQLGFWRQMLFLALALIVLFLLVSIPFVGLLIAIAALVTGIGGWVVSIYGRRNASQAPAAEY